MAYIPIGSAADDARTTWEGRDTLPDGASAKVVKGVDFHEEFHNIQAEFEALRSSSAVMASVKYNGSTYEYSHNVKAVTKVSDGAWKVEFIEAINNDDAIQLPGGGTANPGDFVAVVTPYTTNGKMVIATITDQQETFVDIAFRELVNNDGTWRSPTTQGFGFVLFDQVPH